VSKTILHGANSRGHADHGWLNSYHTFSFADYHNDERVHFGVLRVLNDDTVAAGRGFGTHSHNNMEIISIPLEGDLEHSDNMGNKTVIRKGDIQVMSAGTGVSHSEYNKHTDKEVKFLQIWVFPKTKNVVPRYDQIRPEFVQNELKQIISPDPSDEGTWIHQDAWFSMGVFDDESETEYKIKKDGNGAYLFVLNGSFEVENQIIQTRDGMGIQDAKTIKIVAKDPESRILIMDIPMKL